MAKHIHKIELVPNRMWKCALLDCSFFVHDGLAHILPGRRVLCWECGSEFTLTKESMKDKKPMCDVCHSEVKNG